MMEFIGVAVSLIAGAIGKRIGKSTKVGGHRPAQKVTAPAAAFVAAGALTAITGEHESARAVIEAAGGVGGAAIALHSVAKNVLQFVRN